MSGRLILVPQISSFPGREASARLLLRWLLQRDIVAVVPVPDRHGLRYPFSAGVSVALAHPGRLEDATRGLRIVLDRCIYTPERGFLGEAGCPECRREIGEALFESLEEWMPGHTDNFTCPECAFEDDINGFLFPQPCGFSDLGLIFEGCAAAGLRENFVAACAERLGFAVRLVTVE
ncbi:sugar ABC transporter ATPase [Stutzerimonas kirkiae]|uniref:Sugar ABC transporter ATPase n=1 Tax=Stutzerimonas kirkiae TaxID=2211392 RepID=A0A4Q9RBR3_9GAMM|nr:sugar ABC transporter ATPase [Stutzerimonas kirkiae]TBU98391.1 sugar ABC transporter ATPase [Stutzerimonas kirkiae]TBU98466.1 sugar ABC transporter ATPase [Stutzerimonas kirkiae]TBV06940.1 sugar ABC transporter ATPase [Stutzerimonas kirkiae]